MFTVRDKNGRALVFKETRREAEAAAVWHSSFCPLEIVDPDGVVVNRLEVSTRP